MINVADRAVVASLMALRATMVCNEIPVRASTSFLTEGSGSSVGTVTGPAALAAAALAILVAGAWHARRRLV